MGYYFTLSTLLESKTALVTGSSKGVGKGIALELARCGCDVAINYHSDAEGAAATVDAAGRIYWNDLRIPSTAALIDRLKKIAVLTPQPEVQIRGDGGARYESVGRIIYACQRAGIAKVGFITEPPPRST